MQEKLRAEVEGLSAMAADEKQKAEKLRMEHRDALAELKQAKEVGEIAMGS